MNWTQILWDAIEDEDVEIVRQAIENGADIHATDDEFSSDWCALYKAVGSSNKVAANEMCEIFLQAGANPNRRSAEGNTPLYWAVVGGDENLVRRLIKYGAKVTEEQPKPDDGEFSLHHAAEVGQLEIVKLLLEVGGRNVLNQFNYISRTPLMCAAENNHFDIAQLLIKAGSDVNAFNEPNIGNTVLRQIAQTGSYEMIKLLVDAGADPTIPGWMQITALDQARERVENSKKASPEAVEILKLLEGVATRLS